MRQVRPGIDNIVFADIHDRLVDGNFPRRRLLGHHENCCQVSWAGWLGAAKLADRHSRFFGQREGLTGPEFNRRDPLGMIGTPVSTEGIAEREGIIEGVHATFLRLLRPSNDATSGRDRQAHSPPTLAGRSRSFGASFTAANERHDSHVHSAFVFN
jgi:hypothetical protein